MWSEPYFFHSFLWQLPKIAAAAWSYLAGTKTATIRATNIIILQCNIVCLFKYLLLLMHGADFSPGCQQIACQEASVESQEWWFHAWCTTMAPSKGMICLGQLQQSWSCHCHLGPYRPPQSAIYMVVCQSTPQPLSEPRHWWWALCSLSFEWSGISSDVRQWWFWCLPNKTKLPLQVLAVAILRVKKIRFGSRDRIKNYI